jgi:hypothetical protein
MTLLRITSAAAALLMTAHVTAHHSMAMFDLAKCLTASGTVHVMQYRYPHSWLWVKIADAKGKVDTWGFEFAAPANLIEIDNRWSRDVVKQGDKVSLRYSPIKDGRTAGSMAELTLADGRKLKVGTPACGGAPPASDAEAAARKVNSGAR